MSKQGGSGGILAYLLTGEEKIMKNEKINYVITKIKIFTKKAMKMISSWFNVKHS